MCQAAHLTPTMPAIPGTWRLASVLLRLPSCPFAKASPAPSVPSPSRLSSPGCGGKTVVDTGPGDDHGQTISGELGAAPRRQGGRFGWDAARHGRHRRGRHHDRRRDRHHPPLGCLSRHFDHRGRRGARAGRPDLHRGLPLLFPPNDTTQCTCESTGWACESHSCPEGPPTTACEVGASCDNGNGSGCIMNGGGPCGSDPVPGASTALTRSPPTAAT